MAPQARRALAAALPGCRSADRPGAGHWRCRGSRLSQRLRALCAEAGRSALPRVAGGPDRSLLDAAGGEGKRQPGANLARDAAEGTITSGKDKLTVHGTA